MRILYFASLKEKLDCAQQQLELPAEVKTVAELKSLLSANGPVWQEMFIDNDHLLTSVNQQMAQNDSPVKDDDEVAFFPPVTGG